MLTLLLLSFASGPALAAPPAAGSVEESVRESLRLLKSGQTDRWIAEWCAPDTCQASRLVDLREFGLKRAATQASTCLHGAEEDIKITRIKGDPKVDDRVTVWIQCLPDRMPAPSSHQKIDGKWKVVSFSW